MITNRKTPPTIDDGASDHFRRPHLAIPCWVAPLQSPTPFRQAAEVYRKLLKFPSALSKGPKTDESGVFRVVAKRYLRIAIDSSLELKPPSRRLIRFSTNSNRFAKRTS